jgi:hypothetical protein
MCVELVGNVIPHSDPARQRGAEIGGGEEPRAAIACDETGDAYVARDDRVDSFGDSPNGGFGDVMTERRDAIANESFDVARVDRGRGRALDHFRVCCETDAHAARIGRLWYSRRLEQNPQIFGNVCANNNYQRFSSLSKVEVEV